MQLRELDVRKPEVQDFLWRYFAPEDLRYDYTPYDALRYIIDTALAGDGHLIGDLSVPFAFWAQQRNPKVIEPHIMGDGRYLREAIRQGKQIARALGYERIVVWTNDKRIANISVKAGLRHDATIPRLHLRRGELVDTHILSMEVSCDTLTQ